MVYVLTGTNWLGIKSRLDNLRNGFIKEYGGLSVEIIDGEEADFEQIKSALESLPFLADKKMVIVNRLAKNKLPAGKVDELIQKAGDHVVAVFIEPEIDRRGVYYKTLKKLDGFEEFNEYDEQESALWLTRQAEKKGGQLPRAEASYIVELAGNNQQKLSSELEKLLAYDKKITKENIRLLVEPMPQSSIFSLIDAAFAGDLGLTLNLYADQRAQGIEPLNIVGMLAWQLHAIALVQAATDKNPAQISQQSGLKPFVLQKSSRIASRLDKAKLQKFTDDLLDLDIKFKTTAIDQDNALKNLLASLV